MTQIILDPGSTHDGDRHKADRLIEIAADCGADAIKFQLLTDKEAKAGNIGMDWEWLPDLIALGKTKGIEVFASVFDRSGHEWLAKCGAQSVKYAYSQRDKATPVGQFGGIKTMIPRVYVSQGVMDKDPFSGPGWKFSGGKRLYCIPEYPVPYKIDFEGLFPRFDGFSSHCLGIEQELAAAKAGAEILEFHFQGDWVSDTPDGRFAKTPAMTERLISRIRGTKPEKYDGRDFS
jgi:sialic acid synthase SpsE